MIAAERLEDATKPSRVHRKRRWKKTGLTNYRQAAIAKPLNPLSYNPRQRIVLTPSKKSGYSGRTTKQTAVPAPVRLADFFCLNHRLAQNLKVMVRSRGANKACPNNPRRLFAVVETAPPLLKVAQQLTKQTGISHMTNKATQGNCAQTTAKSSQYKQSLFSVYHNQNLIAFNVPGDLAFRLKQRKPAAIVKFSRMEAAQ